MRIKIVAVITACLLSSVFTLVGIRRAAPHGGGEGLPFARAAAASPQGCVPSPMPTLTWMLPADTTLPQQAQNNQFAWQEFIALNWKADPNNPGMPDRSAPASAFGNPGDTSLLVWDTYKADTEVFLAGGAPPPPWGGTTAASPSLKTGKGRRALQSPQRGPKKLSFTSKFSGGPDLDLSEFGQASRGSPWLTAQNKFLTYYEKRLNKDEFDYIVQNKLYNAACQQKVAASTGINLPYGQPSQSSPGNCYDGGVCGAIEVKAAWMPLTSGQDPTRYRTALATIKDPSTGKTSTVTVGLVGLHIIHKTSFGQQFMWATFEQVDNAPDVNDVNNNTLAAAYNYFNPKCNPRTDYYRCAPNAQPQSGDPYNAPQQVIRLYPIPADNINNVGCLNQAVQKMIATANPKSVFQYYRLVNLLWPSNNQTLRGPQRTPVTKGDPQPNTPVANTTLETYVQRTLSCLDCHAFAPAASVSTNTPTVKITKATAPGPSSPFSADYSFLLSEASAPAGGRCPAQ